MAQSKSAAYDYLIKLLLIGDSGKGTFKFELASYFLVNLDKLEKKIAIYFYEG